MRIVSLFSLSVLLTACPQGPGLDTDITGIDSTSGADSMSSSSSPTTGSEPESTSDASTGSTGDSSTGDDCHVILSEVSIAEVCPAFPWGNDECSTRQDPLPTCSEVFEMLADIPTCSDLKLCDYEQCSEALQVAPCGTRPAECDAILDCVGAGEPQQPMCSPGFCDDFEAVAIESTLDPEFADELGKVCKVAPCLACDEVAKYCDAWPCEPGIAEKCEAEMATCDCG